MQAAQNPIQIVIKSRKARIKPHAGPVSPEPDKHLKNGRAKNPLRLSNSNDKFKLAHIYHSYLLVLSQYERNMKKLNQAFPMIRSREAVLKDIENNPILKETFNKWNPEAQKQFLDICSGVRGVKMCYDPYFKEILNPETAPNRLKSFLETLLECKIKSIKVLPNDNTRIFDEESLLVTDIVVELNDGRLVNIEIQKIGYQFSGQRASCYTADLLLRQYRRLRNEENDEHKTFTYAKVKPVYVIVLMETSPMRFRELPDEYIHFFEMKSQSGLDLELLTNICFIPLDMFKKKLQTEGIRNKLMAWLAFLICDEPEWILKLIEEYPEFIPLYKHLYDMCQNTERMVHMFSEELRIMDRNTVRYMVDEMGEQIEELTSANNKLVSELENKDAQMKEKDAQMKEKDAQMKEKDTLIKHLQEELARLK